MPWCSSAIQWTKQAFDSFVLKPRKHATFIKRNNYTGIKTATYMGQPDVKSGPLGPAQWPYLPAQGVKSNYRSVVRAQRSDWIRQDLLEGQQDLMVKTTDQISMNPGK